MEVSLIDWSNCTPYYIKTDGSFHYNPFKSTYKNIRYLLQQASTYTVTKQDAGRIATISYNIYETTSLWRVLLEYNQINDPLTELYPGVVLAVPDQAQATAYLTNSNNSTNSNTITSVSFVI